MEILPIFEPRPIAKVAFYSADREEQLRNFLADPRLNIDNNPCENVIRPFCVGRKYWLFVGNENGGTSMAVLASFAATCKDNGVNFETWLADVLVRLDTTPVDRITELLPHIWKQAADRLNAAPISRVRLFFADICVTTT